MCVFIRLRHGGDGWAFLSVFLISEDILSHSATGIVANGTSLVGYISFFHLWLNRIVCFFGIWIRCIR